MLLCNFHCCAEVAVYTHTRINLQLCPRHKGHFSALYVGEGNFVRLGAGPKEEKGKQCDHCFDQAEYVHEILNLAVCYEHLQQFKHIFGSAGGFTRIHTDGCEFTAEVSSASPQKYDCVTAHTCSLQVLADLLNAKLALGWELDHVISQGDGRVLMVFGYYGSGCASSECQGHGGEGG